MLGCGHREMEIRRAGKRRGEERGSVKLSFAGTRKRGDLTTTRESKTLGSPSVICNYTDSY
jgi:hypothetical protein